jgi:hypothetical protein
LRFPTDFEPVRLEDLEVVHHVVGTRRLGHPHRRAFVLHDARRACPRRHAILHVHLKAFLANLRLTQFGFDGRFDLGIAELTCTVRLNQGFQPAAGRSRKTRRELQ